MRRLHEVQRAMRNGRRGALQRGFAAMLDVGTSKVACLVLRFEDSGSGRAGEWASSPEYQVIGAATTRSRGVRFGEIEAMPGAELAIRTALQEAQRVAGVRVDHVFACFSGAAPRSYGLAGGIDLRGDAVDERDISRALASCDYPDLGPERDMLHAQPVNFSIDNRTGLSDPRGQAGNRLECDAHLLTVDAKAVRNLQTCVRRCDLALAGLAASAYVSGVSSLMEDERELGAACVDMGGGSTGISIFFRRHMIFADSVRMGGEHVTSDISKCFQIPLTAAERIKTLHGGAMATGMDDREMIELGGETGDWERDRRRASRSDLIGIMRPRVEEILEEAGDRLRAAGFGHLPSRQIVLTGGASQIPGLDGLAQRILGRQVRFGRPQRLRGLPQQAAGPAFAGSVGLCLVAAHPQDEWWDFDRPEARGSARTLRNAMIWLKENW